MAGPQQVDSVESLSCGQVDLRTARNAETHALAQLAQARQDLENKDAQLGGMTGRAQIERMLTLRKRNQELEQELQAVRFCVLLPLP